ncbi:unnamed protein product [Adineta steineri]|uniref:Angiotensin-converting enzyme n=1 Tax=Adineta steineri TaxID=433720 RepID=A0A813XRF4_9BILA|nr:unnamed protein product [Adineta steineri]CAF1320206.1 unnamed protein product [Adineta steineri]CAF1358335.1 unnamed protein product [Adineta steineri]CAF1358655.1 unnamed protein product [Adineta steineri]
MKINKLIYTLFILFSLQYYVLARKYSHYYERNLEDELIDLISRNLNQISSDSTEVSQESYNDENKVELDDPVDVDLWNKLNDEDIKKMPQIDDYSSEKQAKSWLKWYLRVSKRYHQISVLLGWNHKTNLTEENRKAMSAQHLKSAPFGRQTLPIAKKFDEYMTHSSDEDLKRTYDRLARGTVSNNDENVKKSSKLHAQLEQIYSTAEVCELNDNTKCYTLSPYLERLMQIEKDYDRLLWAWKGWHNQCGNKIRPVYLPYIDLLDENIKENGYKDEAQKWIEEYEMGNETEFESILDQSLQDIMPFYEQLHAFVRGRLCEIYPKRFDCNGPIPAHLLGNMWAQQWQNRLDDLMPYPDVPLVNITRILYKKKYTIEKMYKTAENFFTSINLYPMTPKFWARSMFTKPVDRDVVCHASAFDFRYHNDYRVKICTIMDDDYFYTIHHEMGHIEYYMSYANQRYDYQDGANSGFHEAIGDTIGMYAISPRHLVKIGFLDEESINSHYEMNFLMRMALQKVAFLPFAYVMDKYRFALFRHEINRDTELNAKWWALRIQYGGIMAPVPRSDPENFDAGAKFHIPSGTPYARYFIAHILQFQFYRAMCRLQGQTKRLHMCDIYGNKHVGERFKEMLAMGSSKPWSEILESLTGENKLEPQAMVDFFEPLYKWLKMENLARGYPVGWK